MGKGGINLPQGVLPWQSSLFASGYSTTKSVRVYSWSVPPATLLSPTCMPEDAPTVLLTDASVRRRVILVYYGLCLAVAVYVGIYMYVCTYFEVDWWSTIFWCLLYTVGKCRLPDSCSS